MEQTAQTQETQATAGAETSKASQKDAVFQFIKEAVGNIQDGAKLKDLVTKDVRKAVRQRLFNGFKSGEIRVSKPMDDSRLKKYCSGLINNWLKKDDRLN